MSRMQKAAWLAAAAALLLSACGAGGQEAASGGREAAGSSANAAALPGAAGASPGAVAEPRAGVEPGAPASPGDAAGPRAAAGSGAAVSPGVAASPAPDGPVSAQPSPGAAGAGTAMTPKPDAPSKEEKPVPERKRKLPSGFVYVDEVIPTAQYEIRYYTDHNFVGARLDGYKAPYAILSRQAAEALQEAHDFVTSKGYGLKIFDAYRPAKAVRQFVAWSKDPADQRMKEEFYPEVDKAKAFQLGYISSRSGHSRGSTVDLTLFELKTGQEADMGSPFDFFGTISSHGTPNIGKAPSERRALLKRAMERAGFKPYSKEWWHYTLKDEPYPRRYYDFDIE